MPYQICCLQNKSGWNTEPPDVKIIEDDPQWNEAFANWLAGKPPTDSPMWKKGIFALSKEILTNVPSPILKGTNETQATD